MSGQSEPDQDPEVLVAKYKAFRSEQRRLKMKTHFLSWVLAIPVAWFAWKSNAYGVILELSNTSSVSHNGLHNLVEVSTVALAWLLTVAFLFPLRWHLTNRWKVDPERFGLSDPETE